MGRLYDGPIIDAHHHLWDLRLGRHPWLGAAAEGHSSVGDLAPLRRNYLPADYLQDARNHHVVASVHVEANWQADDCVGETRWLETLDKADGVALRYVAHVPLGEPRAEALLDAHLGCGRVVGIRDILSWDSDPARRFAARDGLMDDAAWRRGLAQLAPRGLSFDLMVFARQLADAARLAAAFPNQQFIVNHCGSPIDRDAEGLQRWRAGLRLLAAQPNVAIKISDLVAYDHHWTLDSLTPVVRHCIDCFGTKRAMFASDFPVAGLHASFDEVYGSFKTIVADLSAAEQAALFHDNARRFYRIDPVSPAA